MIQILKEVKKIKHQTYTRLVIRKMCRTILIFLILIVASRPVGAQQPPIDPGPPQFVMTPILIHVAEKALDHGHFVFGEEVALPEPLMKDLGTANYSPSETSGVSTLSIGSDIDVSNSAGSYEGETGTSSSAVSGNLIVAGSNHIYSGNCNTGAVSGTFGDCAPLAYRSTDGSHWNKTSLPRSWNGTTFGIGFDPSVDTDKNGNFYYAYGVAPLSGNYPNSIVVTKSADGLNWAQLTPVTFNRNKYFDDKYYLAIDRSNSTFANRMYISWDRNSANNQILYIAYSTNGGTSWSSPIKVNDGTTKFERVIDAYPAVDPNSGVVYDSWHDYAKNKIFVDKSTNGGVSWGKDVAAVTTHTGFGVDIGCVGGRSQGPAHALKVGPSGTLYLVYADEVSGRGFDILLTKSTNGGTTWSTPTTLNDDSGTAEQFHPTLAVESNGSGGDKVTVTFYDRRDDSNNCLSHVYATQSTDGGTTWSPNVRQTSASSNFDGNPNGPGDYSSSAAFPVGAPNAVWPFFCDHRSSDFEVYTVGVQ
jgi:hypothetical protein